jgi:glycerol-3-phosphate acyltransferase PlsY
MPAVIVLAAYCIGSVPFAWLLVRRWGATDLRQVGSGNLGAANVLRASGVSAGVLVAVLDVAKGAASVLLAQSVSEGAGLPAVAGLAAIVGHIYPVWLHFRGGKGVATACGAFAILAPVAALPALVIFIGTVWLTKYVSLGSMLASLALPTIAYATSSPTPVVATAVAACALIIFRHRSNLTRLRIGTERRFGRRTHEAPAARTR